MRVFPILSSYTVKDDIGSIRGSDQLFLVIGIPWDMIEPHKNQARFNHSQTLERLAERGGLSHAEALAVLRGIRFTSIPIIEANRQLYQMVVEWESNK